MVGLVCLVYLVSLVQLNKPDRPNKPESGGRKGARLLNRNLSRQPRRLTHRPHPTFCRIAPHPFPLCSRPDAIADVNRVQCADYFSLSDALEEPWRYFDDPS